ncbi:MAG: insulinase family protein [Alphaproteobacteria bacterium]|nr:insulinase family protein [Alphaproteobacteria bacterium]
MKKWIILAVTLFIHSILSPISAEGIFHPSTLSLPNGLQVVLIENHLAPVVSVNLIYKVGTADDPEAMHGISHFLEHLMFKGTKEIPTDQFRKIITSNGGQINAFTTPDLTAYTCDIAIEFLDFYLKLEADRMQNLVLNERELKEEQKVVQEERLMRQDNNPFNLAYESLLRATFWYHPYGIPPIGYPQHIAAYTREATYEHYKKWYAPNNAILVIAGDITMEKLKPMVEKHFGMIPSQPIPQRVRIKEPDHKGVTITVEQENPRVSQVTVQWNFAAPNHRAPNAEHYYPLIVLEQILGGNDTSRLYKSLVDEQKIAVSAYCSYDDDSYDPEKFSFSATLAPDASLTALKVAIQKHISDVIKKGVTHKELADAKRDILANLAFARDGNNSSVMAFTRLGVGFTVEQIDNLPSKINAVTPTQVQEAANFVLSKNPVAIATIYPEGYKEKQKLEELQCTQLRQNQNNVTVPPIPQNETNKK